MGVNFRLYAAGSLALATAVVMNAYYVRNQFYPTCVHLATSKGSMMALGNLAFVIFLLFARLFKQIFLGKLRDVEVEHLTDKIWPTVMDTLLIMTIFRDEFNARFTCLFTVLLFIKTLHWLSQDRVDYLQQTPQVTRMTHVRLLSLMWILLAIDVAFVYYSVAVSLLIRVPSMLILFGFEYTLLASAMVCTMIKYILNVIDMRREGRWESKGAYVLYLEFFVDMFRMIVYLAFFAIILTYYGIPLHIIRQLYVTFSSFRRRIAEVARYRRATTNMNSRFPNATPQELQAAETCIVCREDMNEGKKLPCGHILHLHCLRSWLERQQVCPICRTPVLQEELPQPQPPQAFRQDGFPPAAWAQPPNPAFPNQFGWNVPPHQPPPPHGWPQHPPPQHHPPPPHHAPQPPVHPNPPSEIRQPPRQQIPTNPPTASPVPQIPVDVSFEGNEGSITNPVQHIEALQRQIALIHQQLEHLKDHFVRQQQESPGVAPSSPESSDQQELRRRRVLRFSQQT